MRDDSSFLLAFCCSFLYTGNIFIQFIFHLKNAFNISHRCALLVMASFSCLSGQFVFLAVTSKAILAWGAHVTFGWQHLLACSLQFSKPAPLYYLPGSPCDVGCHWPSFLCRWGGPLGMPAFMTWCLPSIFYNLHMLYLGGCSALSSSCFKFQANWSWWRGRFSVCWFTL